MSDAARIAALEVKVAALLKRSPEALDKHVASLEQRIAELEQQSPMTFCGRHVEGDEYIVGDVVQHANTLWHCERVTRDLPGTNDSWRMMIKSKFRRDGG